MYTLNFPNGNVQTYASYNDLLTAARLMGGEVKCISGKTFVFIPKLSLNLSGEKCYDNRKI